MKQRICKNCNILGHYPKTCPKLINKAHEALAEAPVSEKKNDSTVDYENNDEFDEQSKYVATAKEYKQLLDMEYIYDCKKEEKFEFVINLNDIIDLFEDFNTENVDCCRLDLSHIRRLYKLYKNKKNESSIKNKRYTISYTRSFKTMEEAREYKNTFLNSL